MLNIVRFGVNFFLSLLGIFFKALLTFIQIESFPHFETGSYVAHGAGLELYS